jgi:hypothetical protein
MLQFLQSFVPSDNLQVTWPYDNTCPILESAVSVVQFALHLLFIVSIELEMHLMPSDT